MSRLKRLGSGVGWGGGSTVIVAAFQLLFMAVMARLLEPADFGLVALGNVTLRFLSYFAQMGVGAALVQKEQVGQDDIAAALSVSLGVSVLCAAFAWAVAPLAATFFDMPALSAVVQALAAGFLITGFSAVSTGLLRRELRFKRLAINDAVAYVFGYGLVGLSMAFAGYGVWALVGASLGQATLTAVLAFVASRHSLRLSHSRQSRTHFFSFGGRYSLIGFLEFLGSNLDSVLIGKVLGDHAAGIYNRALLLANLPVQQPANVLSRALFPLLSSVGGQHAVQATSLQLGVLVVGGYAFAVSGGIAAAAPDLVRVVLGAKWSDAAPVLGVLALSVGPLFVSHICGVTFDALGALTTKLKIQACALVALLAGLAIGSRNGLVGIAWAIVAVEWARMCAYLWVSSVTLDIKPPALIRQLGVVVAFGAATAGCVSLTAAALASLPVAGWRLAGEIAAGAISLPLAFLVCRGVLVHMDCVRWLLGRMPKLLVLFPRNS